MTKVNMENVKTINSTGFNEEKTNQLIEDLKSQGMIVGVEDLAKYLRKQGLIVKEHIGRKRNYVEVSPKLFGVDVSTKGDEVKEFMKEHIKMGKMSFIPDTYEKKLLNLESSIRMQRRRLCIGYEETFMPIEVYKEFTKEFETRKKEYFEIRDNIVSSWDDLLRNFKAGLKKSLEELNTIDKESIFTTIIAKLPSKQDYAESFYMALSAKAFPVTENLDMFEDSIQDQIKEGLNQDTVSTLYDIIGHTLNDAFENISNVLKTLQKNGKVANKTLGALKKSAERVGQKNIFNNGKIEDVRLEILSIISESDDVDTMWEKSEHLLAMIYGYACELNIKNSIKFTDSPLSSDELLAIYAMLEPMQDEMKLKVS